MKWIVLLIAVVSSILFIQGKRSTRHHYLKQETVLRHVKKEPFLKKQPSPWMLEQIEEDFSGIETITKEMVEEGFRAFEHLSPMVVRYRIVDNELYRYFTEGESISLDDNNTERAIKTITQRTSLPNMDFIISYYDQYPFGPPSKTPVFVSAKLKNTPNAILIPDWRSIGHWWMSEIKEVTKSACPWENKRSFALWRGGLTRAVRYDLVKLSLTHPEVLDARFSSYPSDAAMEEGVLGNRVSWKEFCSCKYLPYVDGVMCAAPALQSRLLSGSLTFKPDSEEIQWFYRAIKPHVHYVPVKSDLSDLIEKILWAKDHDEECRQIAERACQFAKENLLYSDVLNYFAFVLQRYGSCQTLDFSDMRDNPRWVKIQFRQKLREVAKKEAFVGYCLEGTPLAI